MLRIPFAQVELAGRTPRTADQQRFDNLVVGNRTGRIVRILGDHRSVPLLRILGRKSHHDIGLPPAIRVFLVIERIEVVAVEVFVDGRRYRRIAHGFRQRFDGIGNVHLRLRLAEFVDAGYPYIIFRSRFEHLRIAVTRLAAHPFIIEIVDILSHVLRHISLHIGLVPLVIGLGDQIEHVGNRIVRRLDRYVHSARSKVGMGHRELARRRIDIGFARAEREFLNRSGRSTGRPTEDQHPIFGIGQINSFVLVFIYARSSHEIEHEAVLRYDCLEQSIVVESLVAERRTDGRIIRKLEIGRSNRKVRSVIITGELHLKSSSRSQLLGFESLTLDFGIHFARSIEPRSKSQVIGIRIQPLECIVRFALRSQLFESLFDRAVILDRFCHHILHIYGQIARVVLIEDLLGKNVVIVNRIVVRRHHFHIHSGRSRLTERNLKSRSCHRRGFGTLLIDFQYGLCRPGRHRHHCLGLRFRSRILLGRHREMSAVRLFDFTPCLIRFHLPCSLVGLNLDRPGTADSFENQVGRRIDLQQCSRIVVIATTCRKPQQTTQYYEVKIFHTVQF